MASQIFSRWHMRTNRRRRGTPCTQPSPRWSSGLAGATPRDHGGDVDLEEKILASELRDLHHRVDRPPPIREQPAADGDLKRHVPDVSEEANDLRHVAQVGTGRAQAGLDVRPALLRLAGRVARTDQVAGFVEGDLAGDEHRLAGADDVVVGLRRWRHSDGLEVVEMAHAFAPGSSDRDGKVLNISSTSSMKRTPASSICLR